MVVIPNQQWSQIEIILDVLRTVYDYRSYGSIGVLGRIMAVIPARAVLVRAKTVGERGAWSDGTLPDCGRAVVPLCASLFKTVPVERCAFVGGGEGVVDGDLDPVAPVGFDEGAGELVVDDDAALFWMKFVKIVPGMGCGKWSLPKPSMLMVSLDTVKL